MPVIRYPYAKKEKYYLIQNSNRTIISIYNNIEDLKEAMGNSRVFKKFGSGQVFIKMDDIDSITTYRGGIKTETVILKDMSNRD